MALKMCKCHLLICVGEELYGMHVEVRGQLPEIGSFYHVGPRLDGKYHLMGLMIDILVWVNSFNLNA